MFDTHVTVVGNVLTAPEWKRTSNTGALVARFKVASTARRMDRETRQWVDGNSFRVRVNCWRRLAEGVVASIMTGDPIVVVGRLYTRDWIDADNNHRTLYEMDAVAVGHDLARGRGKFARNKPAGSTNAIEDGEADGVVNGVAADALAEEEAPVHFGEHGIPDDDPDFVGSVSPAPYGEGLDVFASGLGGDDDPGSLAQAEEGDEDAGVGGDTGGDPVEAAASGGRRGRGRSPVRA